MQCVCVAGINFQNFPDRAAQRGSNFRFGGSGVRRQIFLEGRRLSLLRKLRLGFHGDVLFRGPALFTIHRCLRPNSVNAIRHKNVAETNSIE